MYRTSLAAAAVLVAAGAAVAAPASAAVSFDPATGTGFVGKGDVQLALGLNNAQLQSTPVVFTVASDTTSTWTCSKVVVTGNGTEKESVQHRHSTTSVAGVVSSQARVRNQITGFLLSGYGARTVVSDGPAVGTCPNSSSGFRFDDNVQTTGTAGSGLLVNGVPLA